MHETPHAHAASVEVHVAVIDQLFNSIDPSPFHARDLDPDADDYIVKAARALPKQARLEVLIHLDRMPTTPGKLELVDHAIRAHFSASSESAQSDLKDLLKRGQISLVIGLSFLSLSIAVSRLIGPDAVPAHMVRILQESVIIGGWVAMWRPMEIFLYDWWPVAARIRLLRRLSQATVKVVPSTATGIATPLMETQQRH